MANEKILLGYGTVSVGGTPVGLTRGGSVFAVERDYRAIEADGDKGFAKGRIVIDREVAKLTVNALELFTAANMTKYYPATSLTSGSTEDTWNSTLTIADGDHNDVVWTGKTLDGKSVVIQLDDAINMGGLEWSLEDKNEVVPSIEFTAVYTDNEVAPWSVKFGK